MGLKNIENNYTMLENKDMDNVHYIVSKLLLVEKGGRPDIDPTISDK